MRSNFLSVILSKLPFKLAFVNNRRRKVLEYLGFGALIVAVVLLFLVYQKLNNKEKSSEYDQISLGDINERLGIIDRAQQNIEELNKKIIDLENLFSNKSKRGKEDNVCTM